MDAHLPQAHPQAPGRLHHRGQSPARRGHAGLQGAVLAAPPVRPGGLKLLAHPLQRPLGAHTQHLFAQLPHQRAGGALGQHPAPVQDGHLVGHPLRLLQVVGAEQHRQLPLPAQPAQHVPQGFAAVGVQLGGGLVQHQKLGASQKSPGQLQPPLHAAGVGGHLAAQVLLQPHGPGHLLHPLPPLAAAQPPQPGVKVQHGMPRQVQVQAQLLEGHPQSPAHLVRRAAHIKPQHLGPACRGQKKGGQDAQQGGLAGPVGPHHGKQAAPGHRQVHPRQRGDGPEAAHQPLGQHRLLGGPQAVHRPQRPWGRRRPMRSRTSWMTSRATRRARSAPQAAISQASSGRAESSR